MKNLLFSLAFLLSTVTSFAQVPIEFVNNTSDDVYLGFLSAIGTNTTSPGVCDSCNEELVSSIIHQSGLGWLLPGQSFTVNDFVTNSAGITLDWFEGPTGICTPCTPAIADALCSSPEFTSITFRSGPNGELNGGVDGLGDLCGTPVFFMTDPSGVYTATWTNLPNQILVVFDD